MKRSKLADHLDLITTLLQDGRQYSAIASDLCALGCQTTSQNLIVWLRRRSARIQARSHLSMPLGTISGHAVELMPFTPSLKNPINKQKRQAAMTPKNCTNSTPATTSQNMMSPLNEITQGENRGRGVISKTLTQKEIAINKIIAGIGAPSQSLLKSGFKNQLK